MNAKFKKEYSISDLLIVIYLIYISGNPIFRMIFFSQSVIVLFLVSAILYFYKKNKNSSKRSSKEFNVLLLVIILSASVLITFLLNDDPKVSTYISIILQLFSVAFCIMSIKIDTFIKIFVRVIIFLATVSLLFFSIQFVYPQFALIFPQYQGQYQIYSNAFFYNYMLFNDGGSFFLLNRNTGIFWEPGAYQIFLNLALFFYLLTFNNDTKSSRLRYIFAVLILIVTIITTKSTTGYFTLFIILLFNIKIILKIFKIRLNNTMKGLGISLTIFISFISIIVVFFRFDVFNLLTETFQKAFSDSYMEGNGLIERLSLNKFKYLFSEGKFHLFGISFGTLYNKYGESNIWNSILEDTISLGYIFSLVLIIGYIKFSKFAKRKALVCIAIILLGVSTEALFRSPIFLFMSFYGLVYSADFNNEKWRIDYYESTMAHEHTLN